MKIIIVIDTGNAAFKEDAGTELRMVVEQAAGLVLQRTLALTSPPAGPFRPLFDSNGDACGTITVTEE